MKIKIILNGTEELVAALEQKSKSDFVAVCNRTVGLLTREAKNRILPSMERLATRCTMHRMWNMGIGSSRGDLFHRLGND